LLRKIQADKLSMRNANQTGGWMPDQLAPIHPFA